MMIIILIIMIIVINDNFEDDNDDGSYDGCVTSLSPFALLSPEQSSPLKHFCKLKPGYFIKLLETGVLKLWNCPKHHNKIQC